MNFEQLDERYYILYAFSHKNKDIVVCRSKKDLSYCYFLFDDGKFFDVKSKKLDLILKPFVDEILYESKNQQNFNNKLPTLQSISLPLKTQILNLTQNLPENIKQKVKNNIDTVKLLLANTDNSSGEYHTLSNIIYINPDAYNSDECSHVLFHELLHCASSENTDVGFNSLSFDCFCTGISVTQYLNNIMNEAYTEILAQKYKPSNLKYYQMPVALFKGLSKFCDEKILNSLYFSTNSKGFLQYLAKNFNQKDEQVIKLSLLFDAFHRSYEYSIRNEQDYTISNSMANISSLMNLITKMVVDKLYIEDKSRLKSLKFTDIFEIDNFTARIKTALNNNLLNCKTFFEYYKSNPRVSKNLMNNLFNVFQNKFLENFLNDTLLPSYFPDDAKTFVIFQQVLAPSSTIKDDNFKVIPKEVFFERLFDEANNYLPESPIAKKEITKEYLKIADQYDFDITRYMNQQYVLEIVSSDKELFLKMCKSNIYFLYNNQRQLPRKLQTNETFYASLFYQLKKEGNQNSWEIVNGYFYALDKTQQKALLENSSFMLRLEKSNIFTKQQLVKFQKEALEFINDDLTQTR